MRGKVRVSDVLQLRTGITPACAGKSAFLVGVVGDFGDHPRVCGEKCVFLSFLQLFQGSPPRVRGKGLLVEAITHAVGITPACAGKRQPLTTPLRKSWDHPRVCGEKPHIGQRRFLQKGSPPRVRGKVESVSAQYDYIGITPACAGKRPNAVGKPANCWDHPRVCGEKSPSSLPSR